MRLSLRLRCHKRKLLFIILVSCTSAFLYLLIEHRKLIFKIELNNKNTVKYKIPGSFIKSNVLSNKSYCNFNYNLPDELIYKDADIYPSPQLGRTGTYRVLYNVIEGTTNKSNTYSITYCTHLTPHFVYNLAEIVRYWESAISVAAFVPDVDANITIQFLKHLCHCLPDMNRVSVHFVFPEKSPPYVQYSDLGLKCSVPDKTHLQTFRKREQLSYPVNVCRNVARRAAKTSHVLVSDVELIPSKNLATNFVNMMKYVRFLKIPSFHVFVIPVFEIEAGESVPRTKHELKRLYDNEKAVYFHRWLCQHCQKFPGLVKWLNLPNEKNVVKPFIIAKREDPFHRWEPIYIGTKDEPFYSETLSWEGQQDKMTQMMEMCLMEYKFIILDGAFLVHWPGIKRRTEKFKSQSEWRILHQKENTKQYDIIINYLAAKYTKNDHCKLHQ